MPNILLTNICNRSCPYCFAAAQVELGTFKAGWQMSDSELNTILSYLNSNTQIVSLLGGEPTLHRRFPEIVRDLLTSGYDVKVFTNGCTSRLRKIPRDSEGLVIVLNLNSPSTYTAGEWEQIEANCRYFGSTIRLSYNIYQPDFDFQFVERAITSWGLRREVRLGLTQPILGMKNAYLKEDQLREACKGVVRMADHFADQGISVGFDCGFRACFFTEEELAALARCGTQFLFSCETVLDIGPDLIVWRCFPFSVKPGVRLVDFPSLEAVKEHFDKLWEKDAALGNLPACAGCEVRARRACAGGCLARTLNAINGGE